MPKNYPIKTELDYLIARVEAEHLEVVALLGRIRGEGDYYKEKAAAKLAAFLYLEAQFLARFAELRSDYPDLARSLEERKTYLAALTKEAQTMHLAWRSELKAA